MTFASLWLAQKFLDALDAQWYTSPTPIQQQAIPLVLSGRDVFGCAQTGTGKTAAFALPTLQLIDAQPKRAKHTPIRSLILTPTRELAIQIGESFTNYGKNTPLTNTVIYGGVSQHSQVKILNRWVDILIATPGRLLDLINQKVVSLTEVQIFILDEADRMLDMGFVHDVKRIITHLPKEKQTLFFSATVAPNIMSLANGLLHNPAQVSVTPVSSTVDTINQSLYTVRKEEKKDLLLHLLKDTTIKNAVVFTKTKHGANKVEKILAQARISSAAIHGNKSQGARQKALASLKDGSIRVLVATDIAARGIDIDELSHVIIHDVPLEPEVYVHRIGRTGRAGLKGHAIMFCEPEEVKYLNQITKLIRKDIPLVKEHPYHLDDLSVGMLQRLFLVNHSLRTGLVQRVNVTQNPEPVVDLTPHERREIGDEGDREDFEPHESFS
jgi:ATP-dependent RNA helicase RhlE